MRWWALALAALLGVSALIGVNTFIRVTGTFLPREAPEDRAAQLATAHELRLPDGPGPHPAIALFSGCDGVRDNMDRWAAMAVAEGWAALIVDSHTPRGLTDFEVWRLICAGQLLAGAERAGDVAVALHHLRGLPEIDPGRLVLLGASHGGWAVLDFLALAQADRRPNGLTGWPGGDGPAQLDGVRGALLLYPYCGEATATASGPDGPALDPALVGRLDIAMVLAEDDRVTLNGPCLALAENANAQRSGSATVAVYGGVTHGFDQRDRSALSPLRFDAEATEAALAFGRDWLAALR